MRSSILSLSLVTLFTLSGCTESQDLGDHPDVDGSVPDPDGSEGIQGDGVEDGNAPVSDSSDPDENGPGANGEDFGAFSRFDVASAAVTADSGGSVLVGVSSRPGAVGCAILSDLAGAPGGAGERVVMRVYAESDDSRCPTGVYAITNRRDCLPFSGPGVDEGCAQYQRWNEGGELEASLLATGGAVSITATEQGDNLMVCDVELTASFPGGSVQKTFRFQFDPFSAGESHCAH